MREVQIGSVVAEHVLKNQPGSARDLLFREDLGAKVQHRRDAAELKVLDEEPDVLDVAAAGGEDLHSQ